MNKKKEKLLRMVKQLTDQNYQKAQQSQCGLIISYTSRRLQLPSEKEMSMKIDKVMRGEAKRGICLYEFKLLKWLAR